MEVVREEIGKCEALELLELGLNGDPMDPRALAAEAVFPLLQIGDVGQVNGRLILLTLLA